MKKLNEKRNKKGSLLLEALLAVVILSVSITLIIQSLTASVRASVYSVNYTTAIILLENKMFEIMQQGFVASNLNDSETITQDNLEFTFAAESQDIDKEDFEGLNDVRLSLSWGSGSRQRKIVLNTYLFGSQ